MTEVDGIDWRNLKERRIAMSQRIKRDKDSKPKATNALGRSELNRIKMNVDALAKRIALRKFPCTISKVQFIQSCFHPDVVKLARDAFEVVTNTTYDPEYKLTRNIQCRLTDWKSTCICPIKGELFEYTEEIERYAISLWDHFVAFGWVNNAIEWLYVNATRAAIVHYMPSILGVAPPDVFGSEPNNGSYNAPPGLGARLAQIRVANETLSMAYLLEKAVYLDETPSDNCQLRFMSRQGMIVRDYGQTMFSPTWDFSAPWDKRE